MQISIGYCTHLSVSVSILVSVSDSVNEPELIKECIPVGCVPSAAVAVCWRGEGAVCPGGGV